MGCISGYALSCHFVYLVIPGMRPYLWENKIWLFYLYATAKSEIHICSNKHEAVVTVRKTGNEVPDLFHVF